MSQEPTVYELLNLLRTRRNDLARHGVARIGVFGSFATGQQTGSSDIDILVEFRARRKTFSNFMSLVYFLEELFGREVELVTPEGLSPYLKEAITNETDFVEVA